MSKSKAEVTADIFVRLCSTDSSSQHSMDSAEKQSSHFIFVVVVKHNRIPPLFTRKIDAFFSCQISGNSVFKPLGYGEFDRESFVLVQLISCFSIFDRSNFMSDRRFRRRVLLSRVYLSEFCLLGTCFHVWNTPRCIFHQCSCCLHLNHFLYLEQSHYGLMCQNFACSELALCWYCRHGCDARKRCVCVCVCVCTLQHCRVESTYMNFHRELLCPRHDCGCRLITAF